MPSENIRPASTEGSLTSDPDLFSDEAWDLLLSGQDVARRWRHGQLDVEHLLQVLFSDRRYSQWLELLPINADDVLDRLEIFLSDQPMARVEDLYVGDDLEELLDEADRSRARWGTRLIEVSHVLIAIGRDPRIGAALFEDLGLPGERLERELRRAPVARRASAGLRSAPAVPQSRRGTLRPPIEAPASAAQFSAARRGEALSPNESKGRPLHLGWGENTYSQL